MAILFHTHISGSAAASHDNSPLPFSEGERLVFDISWMDVINIGEGILHVKERSVLDGRNVLELNIIGRTVGWLRGLYPVNDISVSYFEIAGKRSRGVDIKISEGNYKKRKLISFDQENHKAWYKVDEDAAKEYDILPDTQDAFSSLYAMRARGGTFKVGDTVRIPVFDDRKKYEADVKVLRKEKLTLKLGMVDTVVVEPSLKSEGVFQHRGKMTVWFTDDERMTPVYMTAKVLVGSIRAELRSYEGTKIDFAPLPKPDSKKEE